MSASPRARSAGRNRRSADGSDAGAAGGEPDYVLVSAADRAADKETRKAAAGDRSPAPVPVELEVPAPELTVGTPSPGLELQLNTEALAAWRDANSGDKAGSVRTDRTDYSGLCEATGVPGSPDSARLAKALEEANQQHQWAMEAVITGWESEKADLLTKLRAMTESRDTLEAELRHREGSLSSLLEGILDERLDQMLALLREHGRGQALIASARGSPAPIHAQPTVRKAQQVVADLQALLEMAQAQQAAVEARVTTMQSAVLQLLPEGQAGVPALPAPPAGPGRLARARAALGRSAAGAGHAAGAVRGFIADKAPKAARAYRDFTVAAVTRPAGFAARKTAEANAFLRAHGVRTEHAAAAAGAAAGVLATSLLIKARSSGGSRRYSEEWGAPSSMREIEVMGPETGPDADGTVEIVVNGVRQRAGRQEPALVIAWPM